MKVTRTTWLLAASALIVWGSSFIFNKIVLREMGPANLAFYDWLLASLSVLAYGAVKRRLSVALYTFRRTPLVFVALAISFITIPYVLQNVALQRANVVNVSLLVSSDPIFVAVLSALFLGEIVSGTRWAGIAIAFAGTAMVTLNGGSIDLGSAQVVGSLLALGAAFFWAIYTVLAKAIVNRASPLTTLILAAVLGTAFLFPLALAEGLTSPLHWSLNVWLCLLFLGVICNGYGSLVWLYVLTKMDASRAAPLVFSLPVIAWTLSIVLLHEHPTLQTALGAVMVLGAESQALAVKAQRWDKRDAHIRAEREAGVLQVQAPQMDVVQGLEDLGPDAQHWLNRCAAGDYGVQSITAQP